MLLKSYSIHSKTFRHNHLQLAGCMNREDIGLESKKMENNNASLSSEIILTESYLSSDERVILTGVFLVLSFLGLFGNGIVIYVVISLRCYFDVPANIFILSQALSDFGTGVSLLIYVVHMYVWIWDVFYWYTSIVWLSSLGSLFLLTFNRLLSVLDSFSYSRLMTLTRAKLLVLLNWLLAIGVTMYPLIIPWRSLNTNLGRYYVVLITALVLMFNIYLFREAKIQSKKIKLQNRIVTGLQVRVLYCNNNRFSRFQFVI